VVHVKRKSLNAVAIAIGAVAVLSLADGCEYHDGGARARAAAMRVLSKENFAQAAEAGRCAQDECASQEAGFAYAKRARLIDPDDCYHKGDEEFVEGCRQYGEDLDAAVARALHPSGRH